MVRGSADPLKLIFVGACRAEASLAGCLKRSTDPGNLVHRHGSQSPRVHLGRVVQGRIRWRHAGPTKSTGENIARHHSGVKRMNKGADLVVVEAIKHSSTVLTRQHTVSRTVRTIPAWEQHQNAGRYEDRNFARRSLSKATTSSLYRCSKMFWRVRNERPSELWTST